jgi:hypothetical protein
MSHFGDDFRTRMAVFQGLNHRTGQVRTMSGDVDDGWSAQHRLPV